MWPLITDLCGSKINPRRQQQGSQVIAVEKLKLRVIINPSDTNRHGVCCAEPLVCKLSGEKMKRKKMSGQMSFILKKTTMPNGGLTFCRMVANLFRSDPRMEYK